MQAHLPLPSEHVAALDAVVGHIIHHLLSLIDSHGGISCAHVDHAAGLAAVQLEEAVNWLRAVEGDVKM